jgi:AcrR family transcriptional regulator
MPRKFERARKPEEKEVRRLHLLKTARGALESGLELPSLSLNELARKAKMSKANVYRYFETREALLLALLWEEWQNWFREFQEERPRRALGLPHLVGSIASSLAERPLLCSLTAVLPTVLEKNLSEESIYQFKAGSLEFFRAIASELHSRCRVLSEEQWMEFLHDTVSLIVGLYPLTHPEKAVASVLRHEELRFFKRDFSVELPRHMVALAQSQVMGARGK